MTIGNGLASLKIDTKRIEAERQKFKQEIFDELNEASTKKSNQRNSETTTKQQILLLYYLGILKKIDLENTKKAVLLSKLLNANVQNIRECLTYVNAKKSKIKTKDNLKSVLKIFNDLNLNELKELVIKDLDKLGVDD
jgi:hypothetical protein